MITNNRVIPREFKKNGADLGYDEVFRLICKNVSITVNDGSFLYFIDDKYVMDTTKGARWENLTPAYDVILENGLNQLFISDCEDDFTHSYNNIIDSMILLVQRIISVLGEDDCRAEYFNKMIEKPAKHFKEAIQRMLFVNQLFWQTDHRLVGLGAWDSLLNIYYENDLRDGVISKDEARGILEEVFTLLHSDYEYKSNVLMGDTGQIFVIGCSDEFGKYIYNELTYLFIEAMTNVQQPEPKCLLRVSSGTPRSLIEISLKAIATGIGAPLFANDEIIIPALEEFGICKEDACRYTTSACWEPLLGGMSTSPNNMFPLNYLKPFDNLLHRENLSKIESFEDLIEKYLVYLGKEIKVIERIIDTVKYQYNPLLSVFTHGCKEKRKDVSHGGAKYHNTGITSVAMGNLINALFLVKELVFEKEKYSLHDIKKASILEFEGYETMYEFITSKPSVYGTDNTEVIDLVNKITEYVSEQIEEYRNYMGGKMKVGLSGSAYMDAAQGFGASIDGRKKSSPFIVHISNENNNGFTEIINFATELKYDRARFNGNVVDIMTSPDFINNNFDKFVDLILVGIENGLFEMQMNVVSSDVLIEAKDNPEKFPNLIVRVWGFSSYFNDLPLEYKDLLIQRALVNEKKMA